MSKALVVELVLKAFRASKVLKVFRVSKALVVELVLKEFKA